MDKVLLIDKPAEWTSFDVVAKIRSELRKQQTANSTRSTAKPNKIKVGHSGTLDPFATGLLIILVGKATKRQDEFMKQDKVYEATFALGATSTTGDPEGEIKSTLHPIPSTLNEVQNALRQFTGVIEQTPPIYSAIKINGKKAYELARAGKEVELKSRQVTIHSLVLVAYSWPELKVRAHVSSGTYIRSLAADVGEELGVGAYCSELRRTAIGKYSVNDAETIDKISISVIK